jgi:1,4-alpha-glucan branching enzyme
VVVAPYDAELFGHWWHEGPAFLEHVMRGLADPASDCGMTTPTGYLRANPEQQVGEPHFSSWGAEGFADVWLDASNEWIYPHLLVAARRMTELVDRHPHASGMERRALEQLGRELLLAQSSDWAFIIQTGTSVDYARERTIGHLERFTAIADMLDAGSVDSDVLMGIEVRDNLFPDLDPGHWASRPA